MNILFFLKLTSASTNENSTRHCLFISHLENAPIIYIRRLYGYVATRHTYIYKFDKNICLVFSGLRQIGQLQTRGGGIPYSD